MLDVIALLSLAILFGGMVCFSFLFAPLVFVKLPAEMAGSFIRGFFPWYYLFTIVVGTLAAGTLWASTAELAAVVAAVAVSGVVARQVLMPAINRARDRELGGDSSAKRRFNLLHQGSVVLNFVQMIALGIVLALLAG